jgi:hypothetical protein
MTAESKLEAERRVSRGREIVSRRRELVATLGDGDPIAVAVLKTFEALLALYEANLAAFPRDEVVADNTEGANWRKVFRIMEILREGGYDCDLQQTSH